MPVLYLVRHGQASFGAADYDVLSPTGREQAARAGAELARRRPRRPLVVCGTLTRQRDTATLLMRAAGLPGPPRTDPRWNEYDHADLLRRYGPGPAAGDGLDSQGVQALLDGALERWIDDSAAAGGTSGAGGAGDASTAGATSDARGAGGWTAFAEGAAAALRELPEAAGAGRDAVVVTSGGVLAALCGALLGLPPRGVVALNRVAVNAAITTVAAGRGGLSLLSFNDHAHFAGEGRALLSYR